MLLNLEQYVLKEMCLSFQLITMLMINLSNPNSIRQNVIQVKNGTMINVNASVKSIVCAKMIIVGILAHIFVRTVGI